MISDEDRAAALRVLEPLNTPADFELCATEISRVKVLTASREQDAEDTQIQIAVWAEELSAYPKDIVYDVCRDWVRGHRFFPAWEELRTSCEFWVLKRRDLLKALRAQETPPPSATA